MKLFLIFTALLSFPHHLMDPVEVEYILTGNAYYNGTLLKNCDIDYYEFPEETYKKTFKTDNQGKFICVIPTTGPCPWTKYGSGTNIQKTKLIEYVKRMNSDSKYLFCRKLKLYYFKYT